mgnify:CR=1 FL=1
MLQRKRGCFRQINTSDVIVLRRETGTICCFVDGDGFVMLDGFFGAPTSGNPLTLETEHYAIPGKKGLWRVVDSITYENILFPGQIPFAEIPHLLADTQIYCLPSHFIEGKPTGVLEAGCCGNAVVSTNSGGTTEIIPDDRYGKLIPAGDVTALTEALQFYIDHPQEREKAGQNLQTYVLEHFTWKIASKAVYQAMEKTGEHR